MHESDRNHLRKRQRALLYAAEDMAQAIAAADDLVKRRVAADVEGRDALSRALETAVAVCYMRPFTTSSLLTLDDYVPQEGSDAELHRELDRLRDKVHAHTDKKGGRQAMFRTIEIGDAGDARKVEWFEMWESLDPEKLWPIMELCEKHRRRAQLEFSAIQTQLGHPEPEWS